jgi:SAM-dependent methyltransferase
MLASLLSGLKSLLWIIRRNEYDIVNLYNSITPHVEIVISSMTADYNNNNNNNMLNFGYWNQNTNGPLEAQEELCKLIGKFGDFQSAERIIDVGSGFSAPAIQWKLTYNSLDIVCVNINPRQLHTAVKMTLVPINNINNNNKETRGNTTTTGAAATTAILTGGDILSFVNATATTLPFANSCIDRIVALESSQHFKPLLFFIRESKRILKKGGLVIIAIPIINSNSIVTGGIKNLIQQLSKLGILYFTWASEHYTLEKIKSILKSEEFDIQDIQYLGQHVYQPVTDYYIKKRKLLKERVKLSLSSSSSSSDIQLILFEIVEHIVYKSALKMKDLSKKGIIDYLLIKAAKN